MISYKQMNLHKALTPALWVYHVSTKPSLKTSPYFLVYGKEVILPLRLYLPALQLSQESQAKPCVPVQSRIDTLHKIEGEWCKAKEIYSIHKKLVKH